jgi:hypothetical protein
MHRARFGLLLINGFQDLLFHPVNGKRAGQVDNIGGEFGNALVIADIRDDIFILMDSTNFFLRARDVWPGSGSASPR